MNTGQYNFEKYQPTTPRGPRGSDFVSLTPKTSSLSARAKQLLNGRRFDLYLDPAAKALRLVAAVEGRYSSKSVSFQGNGFAVAARGLMPPGRYVAAGDGIYVLQEPETTE